VQVAFDALFAKLPHHETDRAAIVANCLARVAAACSHLRAGEQVAELIPLDDPVLALLGFFQLLCYFDELGKKRHRCDTIDSSIWTFAVTAHRMRCAAVALPRDEQNKRRDDKRSAGYDGRPMC